MVYTQHMSLGLSSATTRYNRLFQHLLTYRHATMRLQHLQLPDADEEQGCLGAAFKAQLCFFWTQVPWNQMEEPWENMGF